MKFSVHVENDLEMLEEAIDSSCDRIRFGSEFCDAKMPSLSVLEKAFALTEGAEKDFAYVTPRVSESTLGEIHEQLNFLNKKRKIGVVVNDFGILSILKRCHGLTPHLGRQMIHVPARCPWLKTEIKDVVFSPLRTISRTKLVRSGEDIYSQTNLNYEPTIRFFKDLGVKGVDLDWIPKCFPHYDFIANNGLDLSLHLHLVPVTITRKCHTARFLGEKSPQTCSKPCKTRAFLLERKEFNLQLFLHGNTVFSLVNPSRKDLERSLRINVAEFVITMNPVTKILGREKIDSLIGQVKAIIT